MKKIIVMMMVMVAAISLPTMAQNYGKPYKPSYSQTQKQQVGATNATQYSPFQSTSAMMGSGSSYSANPTLNVDGTATYDAPRGPRRAKKEDEETGIEPLTGGTSEEKVPEEPLGDAVWPLMLMALAYLGVRVFRARKRALKG